MVKELRSIERELLAERQKAELVGGDASDGRRGIAKTSPAEALLGLSPTQPASTPQVRRRTLGIAAAVLAALAATAVVGVRLRPASTEQGRDRRRRTRVRPDR